MTQLTSLQPGCRGSILCFPEWFPTTHLALHYWAQSDVHQNLSCSNAPWKAHHWQYRKQIIDISQFIRACLACLSRIYIYIIYIYTYFVIYVYILSYIYIVIYIYCDSDILPHSGVHVSPLSIDSRSSGVQVLAKRLVRGAWIYR